MKKCICSLLLVLCVVFSVAQIDSFAATNHTQAEAVSWIKARGNESWWEDVDGAYGCQCVDLVFKYYEYLVGYRVGGNAYNFLDNSLPDGWWRDSTPAPGAVIVWGKNVGVAGDVGHVGLVYAVDGSTVYTVETNTGNTNGARGGAEAKFKTRSASGAKFIHPNFKVDTAYLDLNGRFEGQDFGNIAQFGTADVYVNGSLVADDVTDYYTAHGIGTSYSVSDVRAKAGYQFDGVVNASQSGNITSGGTDVRLVFSRAEYTVSFSTNGGSVDPSSKTVKYGLTYGTLPIPTRTGYTFAGWYTEQEGGTEVTANTTVTMTEDHSIYAHWTPNTYAVSFNGNGGTVSGSGFIATFGEAYGELPTATRSGYTFIGWYTAENGGSRVTSTTKVNQAKDHVLYAHWGEAVSVDGGYVYLDANTGMVAYADTSVRSAVVPGKVKGVQITGVDHSAFRNCASLTSVTLPCSIQTIQPYAFAGCSSLQSFSIPEEVREIPDYIFYQCKALTTLYMTSGVQDISRYLFGFSFLGTGNNYVTDLYYYGTEEQLSAIIGSSSIFGNTGIGRIVSDWNVHYGLTSEHIVHHWNFGTVTVTPTASSEGTKLYTCTGCGKTKTETLPKLDYITAQPQNASGKIGEKVTFTIGTKGTGLKYQWQYSTDGGKTWKNSSSTSTTATCTLSGAERDGWLYRCVITDSNGSKLTSSAAKVIVLPAITAQPKNASGKAGEQVKFTVAASGAGLSYQWQYSEDGGKTWKNSSSKTTTATCTLVSGSRDGWLYRCVVTSSNGKSVTSATAKVTVLPSINSQPKNASGKLGDKLTFTVGATGAGLTYKWQYSTDGGKTWKASSSTTDVATCTLSAASRDGWLYRCTVTDSHGKSVTSSSAKVTIKPAITAQPKNAVGVLGQKVTFTVAATGVNPTYQWQYSTDGGKTWKASSSKTATATCTLSSADRNGWLYRCIVTDSHGTVTSASAKVTIKTALKITAQPKNYIGSVGGKATFTVKAAGDGLKYQWYYSEDNGRTWTRSSSTSATATCTILNGRDGWIYRCVITDQYGESVTSNYARLIIQ